MLALLNAKGNTYEIMKKVLIGILILIPIIILLVVALATTILFANAHIAVQQILFTDKNTGDEVYNLSFLLSDAKDGIISVKDYLDVQVYPTRANNYTLEWHIAGEVRYTDEKFESAYNDYVKEAGELREKLEEQIGNGTIKTGQYASYYNKACEIAGNKYLDSSKVIDIMIYLILGNSTPAVAMADDDGQEVSINTSGNLLVNSYCTFTLQAVAENITKTISISVVGYDVEQVALNFAEEDDGNLNVGESLRLLASYTPIDSIVNHTRWTSSNPSVAKVDENGVVKAVGEGRAEITLEASVYSSESENELVWVKSAPITINVSQNGASSIFGSEVVTAKSTLTLKEIGILFDDIDMDKCEGVEIDESGNVTLKGNAHRIVLKESKDSKEFVIKKCQSGAIAIENSKYYDKESSNYILSVGENTLSLNLEWVDMLCADAIELENIRWSSSNTAVATVDDNGNVVGVGDGIVTITASYGGNMCSIKLNVRKKLSSIQLRTSNEALAIGLARESVFASKKYVGEANFDTEANGVDIIVQGQEKVSEDQIDTFYSAYNFTIIEGQEYAQMVGNKLVFNDNLEGMGKQNIKVEVSAKYPKYENLTRFTTQHVTITAVYGVEVSNIRQLLDACSVQERYAKAYDNLVNPQGVEVFRNEIEDTVFTVRDVPYSKKLYSICLADDCTFRDVAEYDEEGNVKKTIDYDACAKFYGNVYGNNHMISAVNGQLDKFLTRVKWNGITISNVIMRASEFEENDLSGDSTNVSATNAADFHGKCVDVDANIKAVDENGNVIRGKGRASIENGGGITIEYSIFENGEQGVNLYNVDVNMTGCVIRNMATTAMYLPVNMSESDDIDEATGKKITSPYYSHLNMHNIICSNTLGSMITVAYETYTYIDAMVNEFYNDNTQGHGRFVYDDLQANEEYFLEHFYPYGINCVINQTGFYRAYNWQNLDNASLIQFDGEWKTYSDLIGKCAGSIIRQDPLFDEHRTTIDNKDYIHYAIICSGISVEGGFCLDEPTYLQLNMQSKDLYEIKMSDIDAKSFSGTHLYLGATLVQGSTIKVYSYKNDNPIQPGDKYPLNSALIEELHG